MIALLPALLPLATMSVDPLLEFRLLHHPQDVYFPEAMCTLVQLSGGTTPALVPRVGGSQSGLVHSASETPAAPA